MILKDAAPVNVHIPKKIKRNHGGVLVSESEKKEYKVVLKKRQHVDEFDVLHYGKD